MVVSHFPRHQVGHFQRDAQAGEIDRRRVEHPPHGHRHVLVADVGFFENQFEQAGALLLLLLKQFFHLLGRQQAVFHQGVGNAFAECFDAEAWVIGRLCGCW